MIIEGVLILRNTVLVYEYGSLLSGSFDRLVIRLTVVFSSPAHASIVDDVMRIVIEEGEQNDI